VTDAVNSNILGPDGLPIQIGDFAPGDFMSLGNELTWHNFRLFGLVVWSRGGNLLNGTDLYFDLGGGLYPDSALAVKRLSSFFSGGIPYMQPASFFRVREVTLSYTMPPSVVARIGFGRLRTARLSLSGYNLWTITNYDGLDPESNFTGSTAIGRADVTPYPPSRSYFLGLNLGL